MLLGLLRSTAMILVRKEIGARQAQQLSDAHQKIAALQPKPLKVRILDYLNRLDSRAIAAAKAGQREFVGTFTTAQLSELQALCAEDVAGMFIKQIETSNIIIPGAGKHGGIKFVITDDLLK